MITVLSSCGSTGITSVTQTAASSPCSSKTGSNKKDATICIFVPGVISTPVNCPSADGGRSLSIVRIILSTEISIVHPGSSS